MPCLREVHCLAVGEGTLAHEDACEAHVVAAGDFIGFDCGTHAFQHGVELGEGYLYRAQSARLTRAVQRFEAIRVREGGRLAIDALNTSSDLNLTLKESFRGIFHEHVGPVRQSHALARQGVELFGILAGDTCDARLVGVQAYKRGVEVAPAQVVIASTVVLRPVHVVVLFARWAVLQEDALACHHEAVRARAERHVGPDDVLLAGHGQCLFDMLDGSLRELGLCGAQGCKHLGAQIRQLDPARRGRQGLDASCHWTSPRRAGASSCPATQA